MNTLVELAQQRRSVYDIGTNTDVTAQDVYGKLAELAPELPSAFNAQTTRIVVVSGEAHLKVWDIIDATQQAGISAELYAGLAPRFARAKKGLGTVLLFEDRASVEAMPTSPQRRECYKENNHGIAVFAIGLILTELGLGASLQHHNIGYEQGFDKEIREYLELPADWELLAEMPFGSIEATPADKPKISVAEQVRHIS